MSQSDKSSTTNQCDTLITDEYRKRIEEAALTKLVSYASNDEFVAFKAGTQFVLDNPPPEWVKYEHYISVVEELHQTRSKFNELQNIHVKRLAELGEKITANAKLRSDIEALVRAAEKVQEEMINNLGLNSYRFHFNELFEALEPFRKAKG